METFAPWRGGSNASCMQLLSESGCRGHYLHAVPKDNKLGVLSESFDTESGAFRERGPDQLDLEMDHEAQPSRPAVEPL